MTPELSLNRGAGDTCLRPCQTEALIVSCLTVILCSLGRVCNVTQSWLYPSAVLRDITPFGWVPFGLAAALLAGVALTLPASAIMPFRRILSPQCANQSLPEPRQMPNTNSRRSCDVNSLSQTPNPMYAGRRTAFLVPQTRNRPCPH